MHLCLQQQGPQWVQRHQSLPSLSPADGQVLLFQKQAGGKRKITHNDQRHVSINVDRQEWPTSNKERQPSVHGGSIPSLPTTRTAAICKNAILGFPGSLDAIRAAPLKAFAGRGGNFKTTHNDPPHVSEKSQEKRFSSRAWGSFSNWIFFVSSSAGPPGMLYGAAISFSSVSSSRDLPREFFQPPLELEDALVAALVLLQLVSPAATREV